MHSLKEKYDKYLQEWGMSTDQMPQQMKQALKHAFMSGAAYLLKAYFEAYNKNPKQALELMRKLGQEAQAFDEYKDQMMSDMKKEDHQQPHPEDDYTQKHWGGWGRHGGWGRWGRGWGWSWPYWGTGWGGGYWPYSGGWWWKDMDHRYAPTPSRSSLYSSPHYDPRYYEGEMGQGMPPYPGRAMEDRVYDKDHPYSRMQRERDMEHPHYRPQRERYPDIEAEHERMHQMEEEKRKRDEDERRRLEGRR